MTEGGKMMQSRSIAFIFIVTLVVFGGSVAEQVLKSETPPPPPQTQQSFEAMVAFVCHLPAMHWTRSDGWTPDETTGCIKDHNKIIDYCKKVYPDLSINAISESTRMTRIRNWCESGRKRCNSHTYFVKPFHCFNNATAVPSSTSSPISTSTVVQDPIQSPPDDAYVHFIRNFPQLNLTEHEYYMRAKTALHQRHRIKMEKMMEQWAKMNRSAEKTWISDWKNTQELQKQITTRFQKLLGALTQEEVYEDRQLSELHQQRIQAELNRLKRDALEDYMKSLRDDPTDPSVILKSLKHYIRMEERDSDHTVSRYLHIRRKDQHEAQSVITYVLEHLNVIERRIRQAFDMLDRVPKHKKAILRQIDPFLRQFETLEENIALVRSANVYVSTASSDVNTATDEVTTQSVPDKDPFAELINATSGAGDGQQEQIKEERMEEKATSEKEQRYFTEAVDQTTDATATASASSPRSVMATRARIDNMVKKKAEILRKVKQEHVAFMQRSEYHLNEVDLKHDQKKSNDKDPGAFIATPVGMTVFSIGLVLLIAATLILLHRRARGSASASLRVSNSRPPRNRFLQVSRKSTTKKTDVSNGYENPTYRYLNSASKD